jgi:hypothetical protein
MPITQSNIERMTSPVIYRTGTLVLTGCSNRHTPRLS